MTRKTLFAVLLFAAAVADAQSVADEANLSGTRPSAGGEPDEMTVRLGILDIAEISDREQVFTADIFVEVSWRDSRLAMEGRGDGQRTVSINEIWNPRLTIVNNRGLDALLPEVATVDREGNVIARQRLAGALAVDLHLDDFPFDTQRLAIDVVS